jgi:DNA-binding NarL/FixJ family response regulator
LDRQRIDGSGTKVVERFSADLRAEFPEMKGLSRTNLMYMRALVAAWPDPEVVPRLVGRLPWGQIRDLLDNLTHAAASTLRDGSIWRLTMAGPLQVIAVGFGPGADFEGRILAELDRLEGRGVLRVLDVLFVAKDDDGNISQLAVGDDEDLGALLGSVVPLGVATTVGRSDGDGATGFNPHDALALADALLPGTALAFVLVEHAWAQRLFEAIADTGGELVGEGFLTADLGLIVGAEVAAVEEAAAVIAAAQSAEVNATLAAIRARAQAAEAIAESEAIRAAAAADAVQALIDAGVVAQAAAQEALDAVRAAGVITAAADEAAAEAVAQDTIAMVAADEFADMAVDNAAAIAKAASITVAEAQVLRLLPTKSPFAVIADKLGISRSAAKERAERVYKKLDVHNRADAVRRARELRILR